MTFNNALHRMSSSYNGILSLVSVLFSVGGAMGAHNWTELLHNRDGGTRTRGATCPPGREFRFRSEGLARDQLAPWPPGLLRLAV